jgi:hypothetical protein
MSQFRVFPGRSLTVAVLYGRITFRSRDRKDFELMLIPRAQEFRVSALQTGVSAPRRWL